MKDGLWQLSKGEWTNLLIEGVLAVSGVSEHSIWIINSDHAILRFAFLPLFSLYLLCTLRRQNDGEWVHAITVGAKGIEYMQVEAACSLNEKEDYKEEVWAIDTAGIVYIWVSEIEAFESLNNCDIPISQLALNQAGICWGTSTKYSSGAAGLYCLSKHRLQVTHARHYLQV